MLSRFPDMQYYRIPVTLIKEYAYCPLIAYYKVFLIVEPPTESMMYAKEKIDRSLVEAKLRGEGVDGEILWSIPVESRRLNIRGIVDLVVVNGFRAKVVEVKLITSRRSLWKRYRHHIVQVVAYAIAVEETLKVVVDEAIIVPLERGGIVRIKLTPPIRNYIFMLVREFEEMVRSAVKPRGTIDKVKCKTCFYKKICSLALNNPMGNHGS
ncbi:MAG: CRISPR-associated protein Cas4 [Acidilobaceae archaeon]